MIDSQGKIDCHYTYDDLYQLASEQTHTVHAYANDSIHNRIAKDNQPYEINHLNQLLQETDNTYIYDPNGNLISQKQGSDQITYAYDALDRLIRIEKGEQVTHYRYDSFHRRLSKTDQGLTTRYIYLRDNEIGAVDDKGIKELRVLGLGKGAEIGAAVAFELEGVPYIPIHDPRGNVVTLLNLQGEPVANYRYSAFGEEQMEGLTINPWRYSSKRVDPETGFVYFGRRYYMPAVGRWLTPDPIGFADGPNLYAYVHNRPLASIDPDGQFAFFLIPIAISLALDYCLPAATLYLAEYAGGVAAASLLGGFVQGYNDPFCSAFDPGTYAVGDLDMTSYLCNRAGMLAGAALALRPTKLATNGAKAMVNVAGREIAGAVINKAEVAVAKTIAKQATKTTAQKTAQVAERYVAKKAAPSLDALSKAGQVMDRSGLTKAGRALEKHGNRLPTVFPKATGNLSVKNLQGQFHLDDILTHPKTFTLPNRFGGKNYFSPDGRGVCFYPDGSLRGFLQP